MIDVPPRLYKYLPPERAPSVLGKLLIRFSQVSVMNDIEEFKPPISGMADEQMLQRNFSERTEETHPGFMDLVEKKGPEHKAALLAKIGSKENLARSMKTIYEKNDKNFGILSLSGLATSICMWDKYAGEGRGFLVEFDSSHPWFDQRITADDDLRHLWRISYVADRAAAFLLALTAQDYLYTKEKKWEYESEWRIILNFNSAACKVGKDDTGTDVLLFAIPPDCLLSVTVGYNASTEFIGEVRAALGANSSLSHVRVNAAERLEDGTIAIGPLEVE